MSTTRRIAMTVLMALATFGATAASPDFVADPVVRQDAEAAAAEAVQVAKRQFDIALDGSEASIDDVERALDRAHGGYVLATPKPTDAQLMPLARVFGAYIGEVYRKNHGATWGQVTLNGNTYPGFRTADGVNVWPAGRVLNRITDGPDNSVAEVYRRLARGPAKD